MEDKVRAAILDELRRQSEERGGPKVRSEGDRVMVEGPVDIDALTMVVIGSMAGGP